MSLVSSVNRVYKNCVDDGHTFTDCQNDSEQTNAHVTAHTIPPSSHSEHLPQTVNDGTSFMPSETFIHSPSPNQSGAGPSVVPSEENFRSTYIQTVTPEGVKYTHPTAEALFGSMPTHWERMRRKNQREKGSRWGIWRTRREWEVASWMTESNALQRSLDKLLKTEIVSHL